MPEIIVRNIEDSVVSRLREEADREGISTEEVLRRLLRRTLLGDGCSERKSFKEHLLDMPDWDDEFDVFFERPREMDRPVDLG